MTNPILFLQSIRNHKRFKIAISLGFLVIVGLVLRFIHLQENLSFVQDTDRDVLVAKHIIEDRDFSFSFSPYANSGKSLVNNSALYFYLVAVLYLIAPSVLGISYLIATLSALTVVFAYKVGELVSSKELGLLLAFVFCIHPDLIRASQQVFQSDLIETFTIILIYFLLKGFLHGSLKSLAMASGIFFLFLHTHLTVLTIGVPFLLVTGLFILSHFHKIRPLTLILFGILHLVGWWSFFYFSHFSFHNFYVWISTLGVGQNHSIYTMLIQAIQTFSHTLFYTEHWITIVLAVLLLITATWICVTAKKTLSDPVLLLSTFFLSIIFTFPIVGENTWYMAPHLVFAVCLLTWLIWQSLRHFLPFSSRVSMLVLCLLSFCLWAPGLKNFFYTQNQKTFQTKQLISSAILQYMQQRSGTHWMVQMHDIMIIDQYNLDWPIHLGWTSPGYWYFLEKESKQKLVRICPLEYSICPLAKEPKIFFLICTPLKDCTQTILASLHKDPGYLLEKYGLSSHDLENVASLQLLSLPDRVPDEYQVLVLDNSQDWQGE